MLEKILLSPYYLILRLRHAMYDRGLMKVKGCEVPTICVGNIAAGGTGKTPHVEMILSTLLSESNWPYNHVAVLSRGHKRSSKGFQQVTSEGTAAFCGDEPLQIKKKFPSVTVAVDKNRIEGCDFLAHPDKLSSSKQGKGCRDKEMPPADLIVLDDAFQYRKLKAYFNIVLVDFNRPPDKDNLLPFGRLRDLPMRLDYADIVIVTKCPVYLDEVEREASVFSLGISDFDHTTCTGTNKIGKKVTVLFTSINYCPLKKIFEEGEQRFVYSKKLILFSGIAKDAPLRRFLSDSYTIVRHFNFADHHKYSNSDIQHIMLAARLYQTAVIATTEKDTQRLLDNKHIPDELKRRLFQVPIEVAFLTPEENAIFETTLLGALKNFKADY